VVQLHLNVVAVRVSLAFASPIQKLDTTEPLFAIDAVMIYPVFFAANGNVIVVVLVDDPGENIADFEISNVPSEYFFPCHESAVTSEYVVLFRIHCNMQSSVLMRPPPCKG